MLCNCLTVRFLHQLNCLVSRSCLPTERYFSAADASTSFPIPYRTVSRSLPFPSHRFDRVILCTIDHSHYRESRGQFRCVLLDFIPQRATDSRSTIQRWFSSSFRRWREMIFRRVPLSSERPDNSLPAKHKFFFRARLNCDNGALVRKCF